MGSSPKPMKRLRFDVDGQDEADGRSVADGLICQHKTQLLDLSFKSEIPRNNTFHFFLHSKSGSESTLIQRLTEMSK